MEPGESYPSMTAGLEELLATLRPSHGEPPTIATMAARPEGSVYVLASLCLSLSRRLDEAHRRLDALADLGGAVMADLEPLRHERLPDRVAALERHAGDHRSHRVVVG